MHDYRIKAGKENNLHLIIVHHTRHISYNANKESKMESISDNNCIQCRQHVQDVTNGIIGRVAQVSVKSVCICNRKCPPFLSYPLDYSEFIHAL